jgi:hypothetical protein
MSRELVFLPKVSRDYVEAYDYYEGLSPGKGPPGRTIERVFLMKLFVDEESP